MNEVEAVARAMDAAMAYEVERDVLACDLTREEQRKVATAALTAALPLVRAQVLEEAAKVADELDDEVLRGHDYGERASSRIRALKENPNG